LEHSSLSRQLRVTYARPAMESAASEAVTEATLPTSKVEAGIFLSFSLIPTKQVAQIRSRFHKHFTRVTYSSSKITFTIVCRYRDMQPFQIVRLLVVL